MGGPRPEMCGLAAKLNEERNIMEINIFSFDGRLLTVADIVASLAHYQASVVEGKVNGEFDIRWSPKDPSPPGKAEVVASPRPVYLGDDL